MSGSSDRPLRIGVNALYLIPGAVGGTEIYLRNVLNALAEADSHNLYFVYANRETGPSLIPAASNFFHRPQPVRARSRPARILYEQTLLPLAARRDNIDVLFNAGFTAPLLTPCPQATVFHDLQYVHHPEYFRWFDLPVWRALLPLSAARSQRLIVLSAAVKRDLETIYRYPANRIDVIPHGIEPAFREVSRHRAPEPHLLLTVSTLHPHKNLSALLETFGRFRAAYPAWRLCIAGLKGFEADRIEAQRRSLGLESSVELTGWMPRSDLYTLFARASAFIYPSRFEGFGIPVLEALASGIPTACSRIPSLTEIAGDAVRFFDPDNPDEMLQSLAEVCLDDAIRARLSAAGPVQAAGFTWERSAARLLQAFAATCSKNSQD